MITKNGFIRCWAIGQYAVLAAILSLGVCESSSAQIVPDDTLGSESSTITPNVTIRGILSDRIDGGTIRGANLFHSFDQFNVGAERGAYFTNPAGIQNILSRVTGANRSEILGRLGVLGSANLFLINPKGIVFGTGSSLDVQGSFLATTADAIRLGDTGLFSASQPATSNLLGVSPSAFWFNAVAAQSIVNRSRPQSARDPSNPDRSFSGLEVQPDRTLALVGGDVLIERGRLTAPSGRIELGSVLGVGDVSLTQRGNRFILGYDSVQGFGTISMSRATIDAIGENGNIQIRGAQLDATRSLIRARAFDAQNGGAIRVRTAETLLSEGSSLEANAAGTGTGGDITIDTGRLLVRNGSEITSIATSTGNSGSIQINASELVEVAGRSAAGFFSILSTRSAGSGNAGALRIDTKRLIVRDGIVSTATSRSGKGGNLQINASESIEVTGSPQFSNGLTTSLTTESQGSGDAGNLSIDTRRLLVRDGAQLSTVAFKQGKGGNLQINASESVEVAGQSLDRISILAAQTAKSGDAGFLKIDTGRLVVRDGAVISSGSFGDGRAGDINITARNGLQAENGTIETRSSRSAGGAISVRAGTIRLLGDSDIRSDVALGTNNGGAITLTAGSILAFNNSDIFAFAQDGSGGNITLTTPAFFGENYRPAPRGTNPQTLEGNNRVDINATGAISGIITIPDVSFIQNSLIELPTNPINTDTLLANSCIVRRNQPTQGSFTITGTGGLPQRPGEAQTSSFPTVHVETLPTDSTSSPNRAWQKGDSIVEPQGVYRLPNGKLVLSRNCP